MRPNLEASKNAPNSPQAKGSRLKRLRNLSNLSRKQICEQKGLNYNTLKGWEIGRHGGLTKDAAEVLIKIFYDYGIICHLDWLLNGSGKQPQIIAEFQQTAKLQSTDREKQQIDNELAFLKQSYEGVITFLIEDNQLAPFYQEGDYIAAIKYEEKTLKTLENKIVLIKSKNGDNHIKELINEEKTYYVKNLKNNKKTKLNFKKIARIALIFWHRKRSQ